MKLRCQALGKATKDAGRICYSPKLNTCLASVVKYDQPHESHYDVTEYAVVDLVAGSSLAGHCWWTHREPALNACLVFEADPTKASEWVARQQAAMDDLMHTCAE